MIREEINEIKKQFNKDTNVITKYAGCYVDAEKNIKFMTKDAFYSLPEEDAFKYEEIFRKTLSGAVGKSLLTLDFSIDEEVEDTPHAFLMKLRDSRLDDEPVLDEFFRKVIDAYEYAENYYIILVDMMYDIPGKSSDKLSMEDASNEVYHGLLCSICPVTLSKPALSYFANEGVIANRIRDWIVGMPMHGFLFPAFTERTTDIHATLYFSKKNDALNESFINEIIGVNPPMSSVMQKETFEAVLYDVLRDELTMPVMSALSSNMLDLIAENSQNPEPLVLTKNDMVKLISKSGVSDEAVESYEKSADADIEVLADNVVDTKKFEVKTPGITVKTDTDSIEKLETRVIDGRKYLLVPIEDDVEVNGMPVKA